MGTIRIRVNETDKLFLAELNFDDLKIYINKQKPTKENIVTLLNLLTEISMDFQSDLLIKDSAGAF